MRDSALLALALLLSICGMAWWALGMRVHWQQVRGDAGGSARTSRMLRGMGSLALAGSLLLCLSSDHGSIASLVWIMSLAAAALTVALLLTWRPHWLAWLVYWVRD